MNESDTPAKVGSMEGLGLTPERAEWEYLKPYGYAPGNYMNKCHECEQIVTGVDKRASTCRPCAEALHDKRSMVDDGEGDLMDALLLRAKDVIAVSQPTRDCHGGYIVPAVEWLALQDEVMHRLREHAREGFIAVLRPNDSLNGARDGA